MTIPQRGRVWAAGESPLAIIISPRGTSVEDSALSDVSDDSGKEW